MRSGSASELRYPFSIEADFPLGKRAQAFAVAAGGDVVVRAGDVPGQLAGATFTSLFCDIAPGQCLIRKPEQFRFIVEEGARITYHCEAPQHWDTMVLFLMGTGFGALCYQRQLLPLHASAIESNGRIIGFAGPSGAGKSTLVSGLAQRGHAFFSDDVIVLDPRLRQSGIACFAGQKDLKLWNDSFDMVAATRGRPVGDDVNRDKYFAVPATMSDETGGWLDQLWLLGTPCADENDSIATVQPVQGAAKVLGVTDTIYMPWLAAHMVERAWLYQAVADLIPHVAVHRFTRRHASEAFDSDLDKVEAVIGF